jgi:hypothetical protein
MSDRDIVARETHRVAQVIEHAQAVYGSEYPHLTIQRWSVVFGKTKAGRFRAHVIVYEKQTSIKKWVVLKSGSETGSHVDGAVASLLDDLRTDLKYVEIGFEHATWADKWTVSENMKRSSEKNERRQGFIAHSAVLQWA